MRFISSSHSLSGANRATVVCSIYQPTTADRNIGGSFSESNSFGCFFSRDKKGRKVIARLQFYFWGRFYESEGKENELEREFSLFFRLARVWDRS